MPTLTRVPSRQRRTAYALGGFGAAGLLLGVLVVGAIQVAAVLGGTVTHTVGPGGDFLTLGDAVATAGPGERILVDALTFPESITITTQGLTIEGRVDFSPTGEPILPVIEATGLPFGIKVNAANVHVRSLEVQGGTVGVLADAGADSLELRDVEVSDTVQNGIEIRFADGASLHNVQVDGAGTNGLRIASADGADVDSSRFDGSLRGVHLFDTSNALLTDISASGNTEHGLVMEQTTGTHLVRPHVSGNAMGIWSFGSTDLTIEAPVAESTSEHAILVQDSSDVTITDPHVERGVTNGLIFKDSQTVSVTGGTLMTSLRGIHVLRTASASVTDVEIRSNREHGIVVEGSDETSLSGLDVSAAIRPLWFLDSTHATLSDSSVDRGLELLMLVTRSPDVQVTGTTFGDSDRWGIHVVDSSGLSVTGGTIGDTQCDVLFEGDSHASFTGVAFDDTNTPARLSSAASPASCDPDGDGFVSQFAALGGSLCGAGPWRFALTNAGAQVPSAIHVVWANGRAQTVPLSAFAGGAAYYVTSANLAAQVVQASALVDEDWTGSFLGPCQAAPT